MIGDKLVITDYHKNAAKKVIASLMKIIEQAKNPVCVTVSGESGSGKSEVAFCLFEQLKANSIPGIILGQDDYFKLPPKTNHNKRLQDINWVGTNEVKLDLLDENIQQLKTNFNKQLVKPLVIFEEDKIQDEILQAEKYNVIIAEGTYTSLLRNADFRVFINRNYKQTKKNRLKRSRDPATEFLERVLEIEHQIISRHIEVADVIIDPPEEEI